MILNLVLFWGKVGVGVHHGYRPDVRVARRIHCMDPEVVLHRPKETSYQNRVAMPHKSVKIPKGRKMWFQNAAKIGIVMQH